MGCLICRQVHGQTGPVRGWLMVVQYVSAAGSNGVISELVLAGGAIAGRGV